FSFQALCANRDIHPFPTRRSSDLRLGQKPDPRWARLAAKLHMPYDSASEFYRTYEGAPDSTLGWVTPLLSYPLGVPMSPRAKRADRKSTRLNSSHVAISYAVFCLK